QTSLTANPASASFNIPTIWVSLNLDFFIRTSWLNGARKLYFLSVRALGELTQPHPRSALHARCIAANARLTRAACAWPATTTSYQICPALLGNPDECHLSTGRIPV